MTNPLPDINFGSGQNTGTGDTGFVAMTKVEDVIEYINAIQATGQYNATFQSGYLCYLGPNGSIITNTNFVVGKLLPNPTGTAYPMLLIGSGVAQSGIITDAVTAGTPGINLLMVAGEAAPASTDAAGQLSLYGGGAASGRGGNALVQGGTAIGGTAGDVVVQGGNSSTGPGGNILFNTGNGVPVGTVKINGNATYSGTVTTAKLTVSGTNGSITFVDGFVTNVVAAS